MDDVRIRTSGGVYFPMDLSKLELNALKHLDQSKRNKLLAQYARILSQHLLFSANFATCVKEVLQELKSHGDELVMFDSDFDLDLENGETSERWCSDWVRSPIRKTPLVVTFHFTKGVELEWSTSDDFKD